MRKIIFTVLFILLSLSSRVSLAQQPPIPPLVGIPNIAWGMSPQQVRQVQPGEFSGETLIYQQQFLSYPTSVQYYFDQQRLIYVMITPRYYYKNQTKWQPEYHAINQYLTTQYGSPYQQQENMMIWRPSDVPTQATTVLYPQGWSVRYEQFQPQP